MTTHSITEANVPWPNENIVKEDYLIRIYEDGFPVVKGHLLFIPKFNTPAVITDCFTMAHEYGAEKVKDNEWDGYNIGMNCGGAAGQTVMWPHIHLIPRHKGDIDDRIGGVRNTIPGQANYHTDLYKQPEKV